MADEDHHTYTVNGRIATEKEYDTHARYMEELDIPGQKLFRKKMKKGGATANEVIDALVGMGYAYDPKDPLKKSKGGEVKSSRRKPMNGIAKTGLTRANHR
tara:strand:- start:494 stop:796 length:303 start_codon:yes stop_codon:yes gene_type:complete